MAVQKSPENANTAVESLKNRHFDVTKLDLARLGKVATILQAAMVSQHWKRFARKEVLNVVVTAVEKGRLATSKLRGELREAVEKAVNKSV